MSLNKSFSTVATLLIALILFVGWQPVFVQAQPFAYITTEGDGTFSVIDTSTDTVVDTISVGEILLVLPCTQMALPFMWRVTWTIQSQ